LERLTKELNANQKIQVQGGYPTLLKVDSFGNVVYYEGDRTVDAMYSFFTGRSQRAPAPRRQHTRAHSSNAIARPNTYNVTDIVRIFSGNQSLVSIIILADNIVSNIFGLH
jgi:hypothetical protein